MKVLFSRRQNDFEHVYDLPSTPRVGEYVGLLDNPCDSGAQQYVVTGVQWTPDHTAYDVSVALQKLTDGPLLGMDHDFLAGLLAEIWEGRGAQDERR